MGLPTITLQLCKQPPLLRGEWRPHMVLGQLKAFVKCACGEVETLHGSRIADNGHVTPHFQCQACNAAGHLILENWQPETRL